MRSNFKFKPVNKTFSDPVAATFKPGIPFGRNFSKGDIVLLHSEISSSKIYLNSNILRDALLNSKEYLKEALGLIISDVRNVEEVPAKEVKKNSRKAKVVEEVIIEGVDEVPENVEVKDKVVIDAPAEVAEEITNSLILEEEPLEINE